METLVFISIAIVKPSLYATMIFSNIVASFVIYQSITKGE